MVAEVKASDGFFDYTDPMAELTPDKRGLTGLWMVFDYIDHCADRLMQEANIPGMAIALTDRENLLRVSSYGFADVAARLPITPDTRFEIGSIGKSFTSMVLLQMRDEGKLDLLKPVTQYLPGFHVRSTYAPITAHHLMNQTAGIIRGTELAPHGLYEAWALRGTTASVPPGTYWHYSSLGYKLLGFVLEALTGQSYRDLIQSRVLEPLGMTQTHPVITFDTRQRVAVGYCDLYDDRPEHPGHGLVPAIWSEFGTGDGCQASTAADMAMYLRMLLNRGRGPQGPLVSEESFDLMTPLGDPAGEQQYGYALVAYPVDGHIYIGHEGVTAGYMSHIAVDMEAGLGVVLLANKRGETNATVPAAMHALTVLRAVQHHGKPPPSLPPATDPSDIPNAADYAGVYRAGDRTLQVMAKARKLLLIYDGNAVVLEQRAADRFYVGHPDFALFLLEFKRDGGQVVEVLHGAQWYINDRYAGGQRFDYPEAWESYPGHYRSGAAAPSNFRVVLRKGTLVLIFPSGDAESLDPLGDSLFRIGEDDRSPETLRFDAVVGGRALQAEYSGCPYYRTFTP
jgi:CubicO group peptidase (beta-lactamase class C family)